MLKAAANFLCEHRTMFFVMFMVELKCYSRRQIVNDNTAVLPSNHQWCIEGHLGCPQAISLHGKPERLKDDRRHGNEILLALAYSVTKSHALITINCVQKQNFKTS